MVSSLIVIPFRQQCCGKSCFCEGVLRTLERNSSCHWRIRSRPGVICCTVDFTVVHTSCIPDATDNNSKSVGGTFPLAAPQTSFLSSCFLSPSKETKDVQTGVKRNISAIKSFFFSQYGNVMCNFPYVTGTGLVELQQQQQQQQVFSFLITNSKTASAIPRAKIRARSPSQRKK